MDCFCVECGRWFCRRGYRTHLSRAHSGSGMGTLDAIPRLSEPVNEVSPSMDTTDVVPPKHSNEGSGTTDTPESIAPDIEADYFPIDIDVGPYLDDEEEHSIMKPRDDFCLISSCCKHRIDTPLSAEFLDAIELLELLSKANASHSLYKKILDWLYKSRTVYTTTRLPTRDHVINVLAERYGLTGNKPIKRECFIPSLGLSIHVPVHSMVASLLSLLTSRDLMRSENLIFPRPDDPSYVEPLKEPRVYNEINTGDAYHHYWSNVKNQKDTVLVPINLFSDGTSITAKKSQQPVIYTLAVFTQYNRAKPEFWAPLGFVRKSYRNQFTTDQLESGKSMAELLPSSHMSFTPPWHLDFHAQMLTILSDLIELQQFVGGMKWKFTIDGKENPRLYNILLPVMYFLVDTKEANTLIGLKAQKEFLCRLCCVTADELDQPVRKRLTDGNRLAMLRVSRPLAVKDMGYHPNNNNALFKLTYCNKLGANQSLPPELLHTIQLGFFTRLLNGLVRVRKQSDTEVAVPEAPERASIIPDEDDMIAEEDARNNEENDEEEGGQEDQQDDNQTPSPKRKRTDDVPVDPPANSTKQRYVFTGRYRQFVDTELSHIGFALSRQPDPDRPRTHFPSGYLPDPNNKDDNCTGKKQGTEMRGVLLTILVFMLQTSQLEYLEKTIGNEVMSGYVLILELFLLLESWLQRDSFTAVELDLADKFFPFLMDEFVRVVNRQVHKQLKLVKIHLLMHFTQMIRLYGRAQNFNGATGESHLKALVKQPARRTRYQDADFEFRTATKVYERNVLHRGACEVVEQSGMSVIQQHVSYHHSLSEDPPAVRYGKRISFSFSEGTADPVEFNVQDLWEDQSEVSHSSVCYLIRELGQCSGFLHTEYNHPTRRWKAHGNPFTRWHDWFSAKLPLEGERRVMVHVMLFFHLEEKAGREYHSMLGGVVHKPGTYAMVNYVNQNVFAKKPTTSLYGTRYDSFLVDGNCHMIRGWAKETTQIDQNLYGLKGQTPRKQVAVIPVEWLDVPVNAVLDQCNPVPFTYLFFPPRQMWPDLFVSRMKTLLRK